METIYELKEKLRKAEEAEREKRRQEAMKREKEWVNDFDWQKQELDKLYHISYFISSINK